MPNHPEGWDLAYGIISPDKSIELGGGQGAKVHPNVDAQYGDHGFKVDVRQGLPFGDASVRHIYSSDFYEHLTFDEGLALLKECNRILETNGHIHFVIPDVEHTLAVHNKGPSSGWCWDSEMVLYGSRENDWQTHKAWYWPAMLRYVLSHEGWRDVVVHEIGHGMPWQPKFRIEAMK